MYVVTVTFDVRPGQMSAFLPLMIENARASREGEPGCQVFDVSRKGDTVFLYEVYDDQAAFESHLTTAHFKAFDTATAGMIVGKSIQTFSEVHR